MNWIGTPQTPYPVVRGTHVTLICPVSFTDDTAPTPRALNVNFETYNPSGLDVWLKTQIANHIRILMGMDDAAKTLLSPLVGKAATPPDSPLPDPTPSAEDVYQSAVRELRNAVELDQVLEKGAASSDLSIQELAHALSSITASRNADNLGSVINSLE